MSFIGRLTSRGVRTLATRAAVVAGAIWLTQDRVARGAFDYGYYVHNYEDRYEYIEKDPPRLKKGLVLGKVEDLTPHNPVLVEVHKGAVYLCKVI
jgi:hypothetical protein